MEIESESTRIHGFSRYLVYTDGRIYSTISNKFMRFRDSNMGYLRVTLNDDERRKRTLYVHRVVAESFMPERHKRGLVVNHIDGNKKNNRLDNLEFCSQAQNSQHSHDNGMVACKKGTEVHNARLNDVIVRWIRGCGVSTLDIAKMLGVNFATVHNAKNGKTWKHVK